jgi:uncharacterized protein with HEPN domain
LPREADLRLWDIWKACQRIIEFTAGFDERRFIQSPLHQDAVIRNIEIIGEAAKHLPDEVIARFPDVDWRNAKAMRNVVAHGYFAVDLPTVWLTITRDVPALELALRDEAQRIESESG